MVWVSRDYVKPAWADPPTLPNWGPKRLLSRELGNVELKFCGR